MNLRRICPVSLFLATAGCWTPGPGQVDSTRFPWDQRKAPANYCVMALETPSSSGITNNPQSTISMACAVAPNER